jgi:hypothetical protein
MVNQINAGLVGSSSSSNVDGLVQPDDVEVVDDPGLCVEKILNELKNAEPVLPPAARHPPSPSCEERVTDVRRPSRGGVLIQPHVDLRVTYDRMWPFLETLALFVRPDVVFVNELEPGCDMEIISPTGNAHRVAAQSTTINPKYQVRVLRFDE